MYCMIEIVFDNIDETNKVVNELLKARLISGGQIVNSQSKWRWKNEIEMCDEYLLFVKTKKELVKEVYDVVKSLHSYEVFEFTVIDITSVNEDYLNWIKEETK